MYAQFNKNLLKEEFSRLVELQSVCYTTIYFNHGLKICETVKLVYLIGSDCCVDLSWRKLEH